MHLSRQLARILKARLAAVLFRPIEPPWRKSLRLPDDLAGAEAPGRVADPAARSCPRISTSRGLAQFVFGLVVCNLLAVIALYVILGSSDDAVTFDPPTLLIMGGGALLGGLALLRSAWVWANRPEGPASAERRVSRRVSVRGLMVIVAAACVASSLLYRSQQFRTRARYYARLETTCRAATIRPYLDRKVGSAVDQLLKDCSELQAWYSTAARHPWVAADGRVLALELGVGQWASAVTASEDEAAAWREFRVKVERRLLSRGQQLGRICGTHFSNWVELRINTDDTFTIRRGSRHGEDGGTLGTGLAEIVNGKLHLDFLGSGPAPGSPVARELERIVSRLSAQLTVLPVPGPTQ